MLPIESLHCKHETLAGVRVPSIPSVGTFDHGPTRSYSSRIKQANPTSWPQQVYNSGQLMEIKTRPKASYWYLHLHNADWPVHHQQWGAGFSAVRGPKLTTYWAQGSQARTQKSQ